MTGSDRAPRQAASMRPPAIQAERERQGFLTTPFGSFNEAACNTGGTLSHRDRTDLDPQASMRPPAIQAERASRASVQSASRASLQ